MADVKLKHPTNVRGKVEPKGKIVSVSDQRALSLKGKDRAEDVRVSGDKALKAVIAESDT